MTSFLLKIIAIVTMACDHLGDALFVHLNILNYIGRIAFPIFAFQLTQGYMHTKNKKNYFLRLLLFALLSQIPFALFLQTFRNNGTYTLNIFFTLLLGFICILVYDFIVHFHEDSKKENQLITEKESYSLFNAYHLKKVIGVLAIFGIAYLGDVIHVDYGLWGILLIFSFYLFRTDKLAMITSFITLVVLKYGIWILQYGFQIEYVLLALFTISSVFFIGNYNEEKGKSVKYLFYLFYPIHLLLLYFIFR